MGRVQQQHLRRPPNRKRVHGGVGEPAQHYVGERQQAVLRQKAGCGMHAPSATAVLLLSRPPRPAAAQTLALLSLAWPLSEQASLQVWASTVSIY